MSVTPESSVTSSSFSPCTGSSSSSSSSSSSLVDSPNYNHMGYQHIQQQLLLRADKYAENDSYQDKEGKLLLFFFKSKAVISTPIFSNSLLV